MSCKSDWNARGKGSSARGDAPCVREKSKSKSKLIFLEEYDYIPELEIVQAKNWTLKITGSVVSLEHWSDDGVKFPSAQVSWWYQDCKTGFYYVGNKKRRYKISERTRYYNANYSENAQSWSQVLEILDCLKRASQ